MKTGPRSTKANRFARVLAVTAVVILVLSACSPGGSTDTTLETTLIPSSTLSTLDNGSPATTSGASLGTSTTAPTTTSLPGATTTTSLPGATTTTSLPGATTTTTSEPATTTTEDPDNNPPEITIVSPLSGSVFEAKFDGFDFTAVVPLQATVSDPDGDEVSVTWTWAAGGTTGTSVNVRLPAGSYLITAQATDSLGASASESVSIIVWIPSDT